MNKNSRIYIAGHNGMVGSSIVKKLRNRGFHNLILRSSKELDLTDQRRVAAFFTKEKPEYVILAAAYVGGIYVNNTYPGDFYYINSMIQNNVIHCAFLTPVKKLLFLGSSCIYPKLCPQPIREEYLLSGSLEATNEAYALAKISGLKMCSYYNRQYGMNFISCMPTNLYGPNDNFDLMSAHVISALMRRIHEGKMNNSPFVTVWGTGTPLREFLHVYDLAEAVIFLMEEYDKPEHINIGTGEEISISELAYLLKKIVAYEGELIFDPALPDGTFRKLLDVSKIHDLGWHHQIGLEEGIRNTYSWFLEK